MARPNAKERGRSGLNARGGGFSDTPIPPRISTPSGVSTRIARAQMRPSGQGHDAAVLWRPGVQTVIHHGLVGDDDVGTIGWIRRRSCWTVVIRGALRSSGLGCWLGCGSRGNRLGVADENPGLALPVAVDWAEHAATVALDDTLPVARDDEQVLGEREQDLVVEGDALLQYLQVQVEPRRVFRGRHHTLELLSRQLAVEQVGQALPIKRRHRRLLTSRRCRAGPRSGGTRGPSPGTPSAAGTSASQVRSRRPRAAGAFPLVKVVIWDGPSGTPLPQPVAPPSPLFARRAVSGRWTCRSTSWAIAAGSRSSGSPTSPVSTPCWSSCTQRGQSAQR